MLDVILELILLTINYCLKFIFFCSSIFLVLLHFLFKILFIIIYKKILTLKVKKILDVRSVFGNFYSLIEFPISFFSYFKNYKSYT